MADRPLLVFPKYVPSDRIKMASGHSQRTFPSRDVQSRRLTPIFRNIRQDLNIRSAQFRMSPDGLEPEEILVFEIAGNFSSFTSICNNIEGLDWLGDIETDDIYENEYFHTGDDYDENKRLSGRILLSITNQNGLNRLIGLFDSWKNDPNYEFPYGLKSLKNLFPMIKDIRRWGIQDRFEETGVIENWQFELEQGKDEITFEIEVWFRNDANKRLRIREEIDKLVNEFGGSILDDFILEEAGCHSILAQLESKHIQAILDDPNVNLVNCDQIMFIRPTGQSVYTGDLNVDDDVETFDEETPSPDFEDLEIAVLDGLPVQNHDLIKDFLVIDDPDGFEDGYPTVQRKHGTSMSSIIIHGDLNSKNTINNKIYLRPILGYDSTTKQERVPQNRLLGELIYSSITRMFDEEIAKNIKVVNLSIGDQTRPFYHKLSSVAKIIDWLSFHYNILFIISAGNQFYDIEIDNDGKYINDFDREELQEKVLLSTFNNQRYRRLYSPSESINSISVSSSHNDMSEFTLPTNVYDVYENKYLPSPLNPIGSGFKRSVKPEILTPGGRVLYRLQSSSSDKTSLRLLTNQVARPPGVKVAYPTGGEGITNSIAYTAGTSNSTAIATNISGHLLEVLHELNQEENYDIPIEYFPVLVKTLLTHTGTWDDVEDYLNDLLRKVVDPNKIKDSISKLIGFGNIFESRAYECEINRASILGFGSLEKDKAHRYSFPLPPSISGKIITKKVVITLAWLSPINANRQDYRKAHLYFKPPEEHLDLSREESHAFTVRRGTIQHEILKSKGAFPVIEGDELNITVNCREDAGIFNESVKYGLCVTFEGIGADAIPIYEEIRERITVPVAIRAEN